MTTFKTKFGAHVHDTLLIPQSFFEGFEERLAIGQHRAETLTQVVSVREQDDQEFFQKNKMDTSYESSP